MVDSIEHVDGEALEGEQSSVRSIFVQLGNLHENVVADVTIKDSDGDDGD